MKKPKEFSKNKVYPYLYIRLNTRITSYHHDIIKLFIKFLEFNFYQGKLRFEMDVSKRGGLFSYFSNNVVVTVRVIYRKETIYFSEIVNFTPLSFLMIQVEVEKAIWQGKFDFNK